MEIQKHAVSITQWEVNKNSVQDLDDNLNVSCYFDLMEERLHPFVITIKWSNKLFSAMQEFSLTEPKEIDEEVIAELLFQIVNRSRLDLENAFNERVEKEGIKAMLLTKQYALEDLRNMIP